MQGGERHAGSGMEWDGETGISCGGGAVSAA